MVRHLRFGSMDTRRWITWACACAITAGCSSGSSKGAPASTVAVSTTVPSDQTRVPQASELGQRVGLGPSWQMTPTAATLRADGLHVSLSLYYAGAKTIELANLAKLVSVRDGLFGSDVFVTSVVPAKVEALPNSTTTLSLTFAKLRQPKKIWVLYVRGSELSGSLSATVWLRPLAAQ